MARLEWVPGQTHLPACVRCRIIEFVVNAPECLLMMQNGRTEDASDSYYRFDLVIGIFETESLRLMGLEEKCDFEYLNMGKISIWVGLFF